MPRKLIELLAVESQLKDQAQATRADLGNTFEKKRHLFESKIKTFTPIADGAPAVTEEESDIQSSVESELKWIAGITSKQIDTSYAVAEANTTARADVVLDGQSTPLLTGVPATALLELDKRVAEIHDLIKRAPTLDPAKGFQADTARPTGTFKAREVRKTRTQKVEEWKVVVPATDKFPAQVQKVVEDRVTGTIQEQEWSAMITPSRKAALLEKTENLRRAIKQALQRANSTDAPEPPTVGATIWGYVLG